MFEACGTGKGGVPKGRLPRVGFHVNEHSMLGCRSSSKQVLGQQKDKSEEDGQQKQGLSESLITNHQG